LMLPPIPLPSPIPELAGLSNWTQLMINHTVIL
jgi:hypothetical protein